ncbi:hypothetical protein P9112_004476 [Eukaryota sp. TZLM1-RC]
MSQATLINGLNDHDVSSNIFPITESIPPSKESLSSRKRSPPSKESLSSRKRSPPSEESLSSRKRSPPSEERSTSLVKNAPLKVTFWCEKPTASLLNDGRRWKLYLQHDPPPFPSKEAHENSSSVIVTSSQTGTSNPNDGTGDGDGDNPSTDPPDIEWTETEYRTSQEWYRRELKDRVTYVVEDFFQSIIANPPDDFRDWSDDEFVTAIENESNIIEDSSCVEKREEFLKKRWPFLFGSSRGYTQDDLVLEQQDQNVDFLDRLDQCSESSVSFVAEDPGNCYFDAPRAKYQTATQKPTFWHKNAIPDERLRTGKHHIRGSDEYEDRLFWIAKIYFHHQKGRLLRVTVRHFLIENVYPKDRMIDVLLLLGGRFFAYRGDTILISS